MKSVKAKTHPTKRPKKQLRRGEMEAQLGRLFL